MKIMFASYISSLVSDQGLIYAIIMGIALGFTILVRNMGNVLSSKLIYRLDLFFGLVTIFSSISYLLVNNVSYTQIALRFGLGFIFALVLRFYITNKKSLISS